MEYKKKYLKYKAKYLKKQIGGEREVKIYYMKHNWMMKMTLKY